MVTFFNRAISFFYVFFFLGSALLVYAIRAHELHLKGEHLVHTLFSILYPLGSIALYGSIYITMAVSIERFLGK